MPIYTEAYFKALAKQLNRDFYYAPYRMWHRVPYIGHTALVVDGIVKGGGYKLLSANAFGTRLTPAYIASTASSVKSDSSPTRTNNCSISSAPR